MAPIVFPAAWMFLGGVVLIFAELPDQDKRMYFGGTLILVAVLGAFLNQETTWRTKFLSTLAIVMAWFTTGLLETLQTGFVPPYPMIAASAGILLMISLLAVFGGSALVRLLSRHIHRQISDG